MSIKLMNLVWDDPDLSGSELLLMLALADHANDEGFCYPSQPRLAQRARISERQARRLLHKLQQQGYFKVAQRGNGRGKSTLYMLTLKADILSPFTPEKADIQESALPEKRRTSSAQRRTFGTIKADIAMSAESIEPPIEPPGGSSPPRFDRLESVSKRALLGLLCTSKGGHAHRHPATAT